ncbi:hypothetical protein PHISP_05077 [Aspergillus sp. HF37]|nr:hypothetical protein PHISP_05077 [Aspergillus sp. HF37]
MILEVLAQLVWQIPQTPLVILARTISPRECDRIAGPTGAGMVDSAQSTLRLFPWGWSGRTRPLAEVSKNLNAASNDTFQTQQALKTFQSRLERRWTLMGLVFYRGQILVFGGVLYARERRFRFVGIGLQGRPDLFEFDGTDHGLRQETRNPSASG